MESLLSTVKSFIPEMHFYIMWFSLLTAMTCLLSMTTRSFLNSNYIKFPVFILLLFTGLTWVHDVTAMQNTPTFPHSLTPLELMTKKHEYSKLQRDVYLESLEFFCLLVILILPRSHQYYMQTIKAYERKVKNN